MAQYIADGKAHRKAPSTREISSTDNVLVYQTSSQARAMAEGREGEGILLTET